VPHGAGPGVATPSGTAPLLVGVVVRAHGLRGELVVEVRTDSPQERFAPGSVLVRALPDGSGAGSLTVETARPHSGRLLVRFVEAPDRDAAEALRGSRLLVDPATLPPTDDPDEFHVHQLEGLAAQLADGTTVGTVREIVHGPGGELLVLAREIRAAVQDRFGVTLVPEPVLVGAEL